MQQKTARVAPKNLQFRESIEIKEIPRQNSTLERSASRISWNPNLSETEVFNTKPTKQRNVIIGIVVCAAILIIIIIASILGAVLSQKGTTVADNSLTYNQACTTGSSQCQSSQGLSCPHGFCVCSSPYSWNTGVTSCTLLTYNQACTAANQCNSSLGLQCTNQICQCDNYHYWSSANNTCALILNNTLTYGNKCALGSYQCNSYVSLTCTGNCTCANSKIWNGSYCYCPPGTFLNASGLCETAYAWNVSCLVGSNQCDSTKGLSCNNSFCVCEITKYWNRNFETCLPRVVYSDACSQDSDCIPTLSCPPLPGVCTCPSSLPDYVCNCLNTQYYNTTTAQCVNRSTFNGACTSSMNYTCLPTLYCNAGICACPSGTSWIAANSSCA